MDYTIDQRSKAITFTATYGEQVNLREWIERRGIQQVEKIVVQGLGLEWVDPAENGDLTDGAIFTDGETEWWDSSYAIQSFASTLAAYGIARVPYARSHEE